MLSALFRAVAADSFPRLGPAQSLLYLLSCPLSSSSNQNSTSFVQTSTEQNYSHSDSSNTCSPTNSNSFVYEGRPRVHRSVEKAIRVNHAKERAASMMHTGRTLLSRRTPTQLSKIQTKQKHQQNSIVPKFFEHEIARRQVRPSLLLPLWDVAGLTLGIGRALLGEKMTANYFRALQTSISDYHNSQLRDLLSSGLGDAHLLEGISRCRDASLDMDSADTASEVPSIDALTQVVKTGHTMVVWLSERV